MINPLSHVRAVLAAADLGVPLPPVTVQWLAAGFRAIALDPRLRLEPALALTARGGLGGLSRHQRLSARDEMLRELRRRFCRELSPRPAARAILNLRDIMARSNAGPDTDAEVLLDSIINIGLRLPEERQLAIVLGKSITD